MRKISGVAVLTLLVAAIGAVALAAGGCQRSSTAGRPTEATAGSGLQITKTNIVFIPSACKAGSAVLWLGLGSASVKLLGHADGHCVFDYTFEIEGGYSTYRCRVPLSTERVTIEAVGSSEVRTSFDLKGCKLLKTGNMLLEAAATPPVQPDK